MTDLDPNGFDALVQAAEDRNVPLIDAKAIVRAYLSASPSPPALDGAGRDAVIEECAKVADDLTPSKFDGPLASHVTGRAIAAAIRSLSARPRP